LVSNYTPCNYALAKCTGSKLVYVNNVIPYLYISLMFLQGRIQ